MSNYLKHNLSRSFSGGIVMILNQSNNLSDRLGATMSDEMFQDFSLDFAMTTSSNQNDTLLGSRGRDNLNGGNGNDLIRSGEGNDIIIGDRGNDFLDGGSGRDNLSGGNDHDTLIGGIGSDTIDGGRGNDILFGGGASKLFGLTNNNTLVSFDPDRPSRANSVAVTGVNGQLVGIDFRPANGVLFGVSNTNQVYTINTQTGAATLVNNNAIPFNLNGNSFGVDFNPNPDRIRVVSDAEQNLRLNPNTGGLGLNPDGTTAIDTPLNYPNNPTQNPNIVGAAYTNSVAPSPDTANRRTTLYNIDSNSDMLVTQGSPNFLSGDPNTPISPNTGQLLNVGDLGVDFDSNTGFDIFSLANPTNANNSVNQAYAVTGSTLYSVNLSTGAATNLGTVGNGSFNFVGLSATGVSDPVGARNDSLTGGAGNDTLIGGTGNDTLTGGTGKDNFSFTSLADRTDKITDFSVPNDSILVSAMGFGGGLMAGNAITADQFVIGSSATDAGDRFIYNDNNGALSFDADGAGGTSQVQIATLSTDLSLTNNDIFVTF
jgi:Ca2+-binding RTX toxin-like protein